MSTLITKNVQVGQSATATNNFTLYQPSTPDGTVRLGNGNSGSVTDVASFTSAGVFSFNSGYGSSATAYGCRAWVNFNGTGTVAIRASGNVTSITDNGTGDYTVNFTTAMPDVNYGVNVNARGNGDANRGGGGLVYLPNATLPTVSAVRFGTYLGSSAAADGLLFDQDYIFAAIFR